MKGKQWRGFAAALLLLSCAAAGASGWAGPEEAAVREADLLFNDAFSSGFHSRAFHYSGRLEDGTFYHISVFRWQYGLFGGWGTAVVASLPDGTVYAREQKIPERSVELRADRFELAFGENRLWGQDGRYRVRLELPDFACDLAVENLLPPWQPGDGYMVRSAEPPAFLRYGVPSPWALTAGWMEVRGRRLSGQGQGFGDRSRHCFPVSKINPSLLAFECYSEPEAPPEERWFLRVLSYQTHQALGGDKLPVLLLARGDRSVLVSSSLQLAELDLQPDPEGDLRPHRYQVRSADSGGCLLEGEFTCERQFYSSDVFQKLPAGLRAVASKLFRRPIIYHDRGTFRGQVRLPDGSLQELQLAGQSEYSQVR